MATQTYMGIPNDPRINEDEPTKAMLNGATQAAYEAGIPSPTLTQRASDIARAEEQKQFFNADLLNRNYQAAIMAPIIQNAMTQPQPQPQQPQIEQQAPVLTQGLLPSLMENNAYQGREMSGAGTAPQEPQTLTQMARKYGQDILDAKQLYAQGEAMGGDQGAQVMALAHSGAERARAGLQQLGVDPAQYGLNGTYDEAAQALANNDTRAMQNILQGEMAESSGQYYDRIYKILRDQGFSRDIAESEAHRRAQSYASQRVQALNQAFNTYGHNGQVINPMGIQMLGMMAQEDTDMANYYVGRYAGPLQEYVKANQRENAAIQHRYKSEDRAADQQNRLQAMGYQAQLNAQLKSVQAELDSKARAQDFQYRVILLDRQAQLQALTGGNGKGSSGSGANSAQIKVWQEEVKRADEWDEKHIGQEKNNPYRASANAYKAMIDRSQGLGGKQLDPANNYDDFIEYYTDIYDKNSKTGEFSNEQIYADAVKMNPEWAKDIPEAYRKKVEKENSANNSATNTSSAPPSSSGTGKSSGIYDWIAGQLLSKPTLNVKSSDPSRLW